MLPIRLKIKRRGAGICRPHFGAGTFLVLDLAGSRRAGPGAARIGQDGFFAEAWVGWPSY